MKAKKVVFFPLLTHDLGVFCLLINLDKEALNGELYGHTKLHSLLMCYLIEHCYRIVQL